MNKKGEGLEISGLLLVQIIIGIIVSGIIIYGAANPDSFSDLNKFYAKEDLTLVIESMLASPGDIVYDYEIRDTFKVTVTEQVLITRSNSITDGFSTYTLLLEKKSGVNSVVITKQNE